MLKNSSLDIHEELLGMISVYIIRLLGEFIGLNGHNHMDTLIVSRKFYFISYIYTDFEHN